MSRLSRRGFTLIEMLVVLSILLVLMALLLPAVGRAKEQANGIVCQSHVRLLTQAFLNFAADHDGHLPGSIESYNNPNDRNPEHFDWLFGAVSGIGYGEEGSSAGWSSQGDVSNRLIRLANAPQSGTIWKYINGSSSITDGSGSAYQTYLCPSLTYSKPGSDYGSNGRFDYAAFSHFSTASLSSIKPTSWVVTDPGNDPAVNAPQTGYWPTVTGVWVSLPVVYPATFFNQPAGEWPAVTLMPTPLICQEDPAHNIQNNLEGQHASSDQMAHMHFGGSYYGSVDGSVTFCIENDDNYVQPYSYGCYLWISQAPSGRLFMIKEDPGRTYGWWDMQ